ncbi:MAG: hypothetical protein V1809_13670 [Planctomycetota bacterium]
MKRFPVLGMAMVVALAALGCGKSSAPEPPPKPRVNSSDIYKEHDDAMREAEKNYLAKENTSAKEQYELAVKKADEYEGKVDPENRLLPFVRKNKQAAQEKIAELDKLLAVKPPEKTVEPGEKPVRPKDPAKDPADAAQTPKTPGDDPVKPANPGETPQPPEKQPSDQPVEEPKNPAASTGAMWELIRFDERGNAKACCFRFRVPSGGGGVARVGGIFNDQNNAPINRVSFAYLLKGFAIDDQDPGGEAITAGSVSISQGTPFEVAVLATGDNLKNAKFCDVEILMESGQEYKNRFAVK